MPVIEENPQRLRSHLAEMVALADQEREAVGFWRSSAFEEALHRNRVLGLIENKQLIGYLHYGGSYPHAKVQQIVVHKQWRRRGLAGELLSYLIDRLERLSFQTVRADIRDDLSTSLAFYRSHGFVQKAQRPGGSARKRNILVHIRELSSETLFSHPGLRTGHAIRPAILHKAAKGRSVYAFDLNVLLDLVRDRSFADKAGRLFSAGLAHDIRLAVSDEFTRELHRTASDSANDTLLQFALQLPRLMSVDSAACDALANDIHHTIFVEDGRADVYSAQSISDARHIAHAALAHASAFVTRDSSLLRARDKLFARFGIDIISLNEAIEILPQRKGQGATNDRQGVDFALRTVSSSQLETYFETCPQIGSKIVDFITDTNSQESLISAVESVDGVVAVSALLFGQSVKDRCRAVLVADEDHPKFSLFADTLIDTILAAASRSGPVLVDIYADPSQSALRHALKARGFIATSEPSVLTKLAVGHPVTHATWATTVAEVRRHTGVELPAILPTTTETTLKVSFGHNSTFELPYDRVGEYFSPSIVVLRNTIGVIVPIQKAYADELLGTAQNRSFDFLHERDVAFANLRGYVSRVVGMKALDPGSIVLFYESIRSGGRGAIVAIARLVDRTIVPKHLVSRNAAQLLVVDDPDRFAAGDRALLTTFDNVLQLPVPVKLRVLRDIGAVGGQNLITSTTISTRLIEKIVDIGWRRSV